MGEFRMPSLGADMDVGTVVEWRVQPGDRVHRGDIVAVVDTEKSDIEVEVFEDGVVEELLVDVGREVHVGTPLARIGDGGAVAPAPAAAGHVRATPRARRLAAATGVDLAGVAGSGPDGAVRSDDLTRSGPPATTEPPPSAPGPPEAPEPPPSAPAPAPPPGRRATGALMARSKREIPHFHVASTIDLAVATAWLTRRNDGLPPAARILPAALLLRASALAALEVPSVNGTWEGDAHRPSEAVHLGVAIAQRGGGLVAPAIRDAGHLGLVELMAALRDVVERARAGRLRSSELAGATLTVTNLGDQGAEEVVGVIYPPQVALVGFGKVVERPCAVDGMLAVHPSVRASLVADHRVSDGHDASRFLTTLDRLLQRPGEL